MSEYQKNDKVVCVNDSMEGAFGISAGMLRFPGGSVVKGVIYCVERSYHGEQGTQGLVLTSPKIYLRGGPEIGFNSTRFRKVHPKENTVEQQESDASTAPAEVEEPARVFDGPRCFGNRDGMIN